ncbi:hypothetical protein D3C78_850260 [compost metagenome]
MQAVVGIQRRIAHGRADWRQRGHFIEDGLGIRPDHPQIAHARRQRAEDLPVGPGLARRADRAADALHPALAVGEGAVLLGKGRRRQHHVGQLGRLGHRQLDHHQKVQRAQGVLDVVLVGVGEHRLLAHDHQRLEVAGQRRRGHAQRSQPGRLRHRHAPGLGELGLHLAAVGRLIAGIDVGQTAHVAGALHVVLPAQRVDAGAGTADLAAHQGQVGNRHHVVGAALELGDAHAVGDEGGPGVTHRIGQPLQLGHRHAGLRAAQLRRQAGHMLAQDVDVLAALVEKRPVFPAIGEDDLQQAIEQGDVAAQLELHMLVGQPGEARLPRIDHHQLRTARLGAQDARADHRVILAGIGTDQQDQVGLVDIGNAAGHRSGAEGQGQAGHRGAVADARTVVDIVAAQHGPGEFLCRVIVLVGRPRAADHPHRTRPTFRQRVAEGAGHPLQRLVPAGRAQACGLADQRTRQAVGGVDGEAGRPALAAQLALADRMAGLRLDTDHPATLHPQADAAANPAERANARNHTHRRLSRHAIPIKLDRQTSGELDHDQERPFFSDDLNWKMLITHLTCGRACFDTRKQWPAALRSMLPRTHPLRRLRDTPALFSGQPERQRTAATGQHHPAQPSPAEGRTPVRCRHPAPLFPCGTQWRNQDLPAEP